MKKTLQYFVIFAGLLVYYPPANASFHLWEISEIFSNSDGTIQYIELLTSSPSEQLLSGHKIVSSGPGLATLEFTFDSDLSGSTADRKLLLATERFALLTGIVPDYIIPTKFIPRVAGTIDFAESADQLTYSAGKFPLNGAQSLGGDGVPQSPSPTNFDGVSALLPTQALPYASVNQTSSQLEIPVLAVPGFGIAHVTLGINFDTLAFELLDFYLYDPVIVQGDRPATFDGTLNIPSLVFLSDDFNVRLSIVQDPPLVFGNAQILNVTPVLPDPEPAQVPNPQPNLLEESIARGMNIYASLCSTCHGINGQGSTLAPSLTQTSPLEQLRSFINSNMPFGNPGQCVDSGSATCATDVANYVKNRLSTAAEIDY